MKRVKYSVYSLLLILSLFVSLVVPTGTANATSVYDGTYRTTDTISLSNTASGSRGACSPVDYSSNWITLFDQASNPYSSQQTDIDNLKASYLVALEDGRWGVSQFEDSTAGYVGINIYWTEDTSLALSWQEGNAGYRFIRPTGNDLKSISFVTQAVWWGNSNCEPYVMFALSTYRPYVSDEEGGYRKNFFVRTDSPNYPVGYEGTSIRTMPPAAKYVAMGDSFSAAEGNPSFEAGTDVAGVNECHRSPLAYPRLLQSQLNLGLTAFVACSGAKAANITDGQWNEPPQTDALSGETEVATITIGGNDVKFKEFAEKCVSPISAVCDEYTPIYDEVTGLITNSLPAKLESVYTSILTKAPNAEIYVGGYPLIAPFKYISDPFDQDCGGLYDEIPNNWGDARAAYEVVNLLNTTIENAVTTVNTQQSTTRLHYVNVSDGAFVGHDICSSDSYFNGIDVFNPEYSLHPDSDGQVAYATEFEEAMS